MNSTKPIKIIQADKRKRFPDWKEINTYRELMWTLTYRDFRVKYAQTALGFLWAILNPLFTLVILSFVFGTVAKVDTGDVPHILYTIAGLCGWTYFASVLSTAGQSLIASQNMIKKIYFPRLIIPFSKAITGLIDLIVVFVILAILMAIYGFAPSPNLIYLPLFVLMALLAGLTAGIWASALTIRYRDFKQIIPVILRLGMYVTPIAYPASAVPEKFKLLFFINPMAGVVEGMRWSIIGGPLPQLELYISFGIVLFFFITGLMYFTKIEKVMVDII